MQTIFEYVAHKLCYPLDSEVIGTYLKENIYGFVSIKVGENLWKVII